MAQDLVPGDSLMPLYRRVVKQHDKDYEHLWQPYYRYWEPTHHAVDRFAYGPCSTAISFTITTRISSITRQATWSQPGGVGGEGSLVAGAGKWDSAST